MMLVPQYLHNGLYYIRNIAELAAAHVQCDGSDYYFFRSFSEDGCLTLISSK